MNQPVKNLLTRIVTRVWDADTEIILPDMEYEELLRRVEWALRDAENLQVYLDVLEFIHRTQIILPTLVPYLNSSNSLIADILLNGLGVLTHTQLARLATCRMSMQHMRAELYPAR